MVIQLTTKSKELYKAFNDYNIKLIVSYGGTSSGKTISILQLLTIYAMHANANHPKTITVIGETYPVLRRGPIKDWREIVMGGSYDPNSWNGGSSQYTFPNGSIIQFVSGDNPQKFRGMRSHIVYFDEVTNIKFESYKQLTMRTREKVIVSFNPSHEFFIKDEMARDDCAIIHSTYKDNPFVEDAIIQELEQRAKMDINFKNVYVLGNWGTYEGNIFQEEINYFIVPEIPEIFRTFEQRKVFALDWGFSNDPTTILELTLYKSKQKDITDKLFIKEHLYKTGLINSDIAKIMRNVNPKNIITIADSADPKSIADFNRTYRIKMEAAKKGPGSILSGINLLKEIEIYIESDSINTIKEFRNYTWATDRNGEQLTKPIDMFNHSIDAIRYGYTYMREKTRTSKISATIL